MLTIRSRRSAYNVPMFGVGRVLGGLLLGSALVCSAQQAGIPLAETHSTPDPALASYCQSLLPSNPQGHALEQACNFSLSLSHHMPNFTCEMKVEKFEDINQNMRSSVYMQRIQARARYVNGKDSYDDLRVNGKLMKDDSALIEGTWSFGEFGIKLLAAFAPKDHPSFKYVRNSTIDGIESYEYEFRVRHADNLIWRWIWGTRSTLPGYSGKIWLSRHNGRILRLHLNSSEGVPEDFPIRSVESRTEYSYVDFKDGSGFVLPSKVKINTLMGDKRLIRTTIDFNKCQRFRVDSRIVMDASSE